MKLANYLDERRVLVGLKAKSKDDALRALARLFARGHEGIDSDRAYEVIREREEIAATGIGNGLALPHGKISGIKKPVYSLALFPEGVDWGAADRKPVRILAAVLAPDGSAADPVKLLARLARPFRDADFRSRLGAARSVSAALKVLRDGEGA